MLATTPEPRTSADDRDAKQRAAAAMTIAAHTRGSQTRPATSAVPSIQISAGSRIWSIGAVTIHGSPIRTPSSICEADSTAPRWGAYQA